MHIAGVKHKGSFARVQDVPKFEWAEYAFIGRSNVGKSSLINMLINQQGFAHVSSSPGKTQIINYFEVDESWFLVDLPGYGYARVSKKKRNLFKDMIRNYFSKRQMLACAFVLIDVNIKPQKIDLEFINFLGEAGVPFAVVYTKSDKSKPHEVEANQLAFRTALLEDWQYLPKEFTTSSEKRIGKDEILDYIESINTQIEENA